MVFQSRTYCTYGFVAVLGNILEPDTEKNLDVWHTHAQSKQEDKRIFQSHPWLSNEFKDSLDHRRPYLYIKKNNKVKNKEGENLPHAFK